MKGFIADDSGEPGAKLKHQIQSLDGGWLCSFLLPFVGVAATSRHRKILGESIRSHRKRGGMSQERLAEKADLHHNYVGALERGEKVASIDSLVKIAKALGVRPSDLLRNL